MYVNEKMKPVETTPGMGRGDKEEWWKEVNSTMINCKKFCKCYNVPLVQQFFLKFKK
jgi:hypothetical protein